MADRSLAAAQEAQGGRRQMLLEVVSLDAEGEYVLKPLGRPVLHSV